ncbi:unnamed protein product [Paramecium sonneborni]|uniref:Uncharacterized protein n=1 Tax=Paramecium sonneborni TaxID=65129 RepID=A0A8S1P8Y0_9CILI|nr:unnamed protein product [Paramecium sonneborni]
MKKWNQDSLGDINFDEDQLESLAYQVPKNFLNIDSYSYPDYQNNYYEAEEDSNIEDQKPSTQIIQDNSKKHIVPKIVKLIQKDEKQLKKPIQINQEIKQQEQNNEIFMLPGESKNIPKNYTRALKHFISIHFSQTIINQNPEIKKFLATKPEKACKQTLESSLKSCVKLKQIAQMFFGQYLWGSIFLEENKAEVEPYFRFNKVWFRSKKQ